MLTSVASFDAQQVSAALLLRLIAQLHAAASAHHQNTPSTSMACGGAAHAAALRLSDLDDAADDPTLADCCRCDDMNSAAV